MKIEATSTNYCITMSVRQFNILQKHGWNAISDALRPADADSLTYDDHYGPFVFIRCQPDQAHKALKIIQELARQRPPKEA